MKINIPYEELDFIASRSSGAGGQNVNKVNSKITLHWNVLLTTAISSEIVERFLIKYKNRVSVEGIVTVTSDEHRTQKLNKDAAIEKLLGMIATVYYPPKIRKKTKPTHASKLQRLTSKKKRSDVKKMRSEKF